MDPSFAFFLFVIGTGGLFFLDRDKSVRTSRAVWLPVIWLWINASRPVSAWLGVGAANAEAVGQLPETSLLDQVVAASLMLSGIIVVARRRDVKALLRASWPIMLYFSYCLVGLVFSDFAGWGSKRWVRAVGDLIMVLVVVTDRQPTAALSRLFSRVGFVLVPASIVLIKYFPNLGQAWDIWGYHVNIGVATNKNSLGAITFVLGLGTLWQVLSLLHDKKQLNRNRRLLAQGTLLFFEILLFSMAHSATSGASFAIGAGLMVIAAMPLMRHRPAALHALVLAVVLGGSLAALLGGEAAATEAMGRNSDLTGRTAVWKEVIPMVPNPIIGAGFETFWLGPRVEAIRRFFGSFVNEAHNGYIEVYLNLGWLGIAMIALILVHGYGKAISTFRRDPALGALLVAGVVTAVTYNIAEAGFRMLNPPWIFLLLSVLAASRVPSSSEGSQQSRRQPANATVWMGEYDPPQLNSAWMKS